MKYLITVFLLISTFNANAYSIHHVGGFNGTQYNELLDTFLKQEIDVYAGIDPSNNKKYVTFIFDGAIEDFRYKVEYNSPQFNYIITSFEKATAWGKVAKDNATKITKKLVPDSDCANTTYFWCNITFMSFNNGASYQVYWQLENNENIWTKDTIVYYNTKYIPSALSTLNSIQAKFDELVLLEDNSNLFN